MARTLENERTTGVVTDTLVYSIRSCLVNRERASGSASDCLP